MNWSHYLWSFIIFLEIRKYCLHLWGSFGPCILIEHLLCARACSRCLDTAVNKTDKHLCHQGAYSPVVSFNCPCGLHIVLHVPSVLSVFFFCAHHPITSAPTAVLLLGVEGCALLTSGSLCSIQCICQVSTEGLNDIIKMLSSPQPALFKLGPISFFLIHLWPGSSSPPRTSFSSKIYYHFAP